MCEVKRLMSAKLGEGEKEVLREAQGSQAIGYQVVYNMCALAVRLSQQGLTVHSHMN